MSTTPDLPGLPGNNLDRDDNAVFDELARRAGAALRRPAPADGVRAIAARRRRQQALKATAVGGVLVATLIGTLVVVAGRDDPDRLPPVDSTPDTLTTVDAPSPPPTLSEDITPDTNLTTTFISPRNGFSVNYFDRGEGTVTPATQPLGLSVDDGFDVVETGLAAVFKGASTEIPPPTERPGVSLEQWLDEPFSEHPDLANGCGVPRSQQAEITIDGESGRIAECPNHIEATVVVGGRLYLFTLSHDRSDARAVFDAFAATIDLTPETGVDFIGLTETFVSPTYGYSFGYIRGLTPATELWDPSNQPVDDINPDPRFDAVETGYGAYLEGASTPIPDGVSIDEWVDQYVTPLAAGGCGVPRSQQAEITIDGQPGRIAECDHTEATVVAGGRLYLFILYRSGHDARAMFDAWVATIDLTPETATVP